MKSKLFYLSKVTKQVYIITLRLCLYGSHCPGHGTAQHISLLYLEMSTVIWTGKRSFWIRKCVVGWVKRKGAKKSLFQSDVLSRTDLCETFSYAVFDA